MRNLFFKTIVLASMLGPFGLHAQNIETGKMVSAFLEATGSEKEYINAAQLAFQDNEILFQTADGQWIPVSFIGKDDNGIFVYAYFERCSVCGKRAPDGVCINVQCRKYMK